MEGGVFSHMEGTGMRERERERGNAVRVRVDESVEVCGT